MMSRAVACAAFFAVILPAEALAEVADKIPSIRLLWLAGVGSFLTCLLAVRFLPARAACLVALGALFGAANGLAVLFDAQVGPVAISEAGSAYSASAAGAPLLGCVGVLIGLLWKRRSPCAAA